MKMYLVKLMRIVFSKRKYFDTVQVLKKEKVENIFPNHQLLDPIEYGF